MGALTTYLIYKSGKKKGRRLYARSIEADLERLHEICKNCGYMAMQHSQDARRRCPSYD